MIRIMIKRNQQGELRRILIKGHADYAEHGRDIVCAAVSGISIGMINAIEKLLDIQVVSGVDDTGQLDLCIPTISDQSIRSQVQLLLEAMVIALTDVANEYPSYVQINQ